MDQFPFKRFVDLFTQTAHPCFNDIGLRIKIIFPDMFNNHGLGNDPPRIPHKVLQQHILLRLNVDPLSGAMDLVAEQVDRQIGKRESRGFHLTGSTAQERLNPGKQLGE